MLAERRSTPVRLRSLALRLLRAKATICLDVAMPSVVSNVDPMTLQRLDEK
jgi:hypothetical protein